MDITVPQSLSDIFSHKDELPGKINTKKKKGTKSKMMVVSQMSSAHILLHFVRNKTVNF